MKLTYLGTAAAEGWPGVFCNCEYCQKAKRRGGKNIRTRSQTMVNDDLLLDFPGDTYAHMLQSGLDFSAVRYCFVTHSHSDHWLPTDLLYRMEGCFAHDMTTPGFDFYGNEAVYQKFEKLWEILNREKNPYTVTPHILHPFETVIAGEYEVTPLPADHLPDEQAFVYLIRQGEKVLLYLHDTGLLPEESIAYLAKKRVKADLISYDCTNVILGLKGRSHMGLNNIQTLREKFQELGISHQNTLSVINHFSHNGKLIHDELEPIASKMGLITAFDGMTVTF